MFGCMGWAPRRFRTALTIAFLSGLCAGYSKAEDPFWPEFDTYLKLSPNTRLLFTAEANDNRDEPKSKWIVASYLDIFVPRFKPVLFRRISELDESRNQRIVISAGYRFSHTWGTE